MVKDIFMTTAIIVAAGSGTRLKGSVRKQYRQAAGRPILAHTLKKFDDCASIGRICLVVPAEDFDFCRRHILPAADASKPVQLVAGGRKRQESVYNGVQSLETKRGMVVIHDGVRPLIDIDLITACIEAAEVSGACILGLPASDTIKRVEKSNLIKGTLDRDDLWLAQTPQVFRYDVIAEAHAKALDDGFTGTDDAMLVERLGCPVSVIRGSKVNIKVTTTEDLVMAEAFLRLSRG